ncbi:MAG: hypothetical protein HY654_05380 [Acidobacteria bacterium]|nr:hypothetical protein [Acidobacteriota bacterium]
MNSEPATSEFRFEKQKTEATVTLSSGEVLHGCFFTALGVTWREGPERVGDLLNSEAGFLPFEVRDAGGVRTVLCNRTHVVAVAIATNEASEDADYAIARRRRVSIHLSTGARITGVLHVALPEGHNRLSDWARLPDRFRYVDRRPNTSDQYRPHRRRVGGP